MGIEVFLASEDLGGNLVLLGRDSRMFKGMIRQVLEKLAERLRAVESTAAEQLFEMRELLGAIRHAMLQKEERDSIVTPT
jgi:signal transduction histidine kinase